MRWSLQLASCLDIGLNRGGVERMEFGFGWRRAVPPQGPLVVDRYTRRPQLEESFQVTGSLGPEL